MKSHIHIIIRNYILLFTALIIVICLCLGIIKLPKIKLGGKGTLDLLDPQKAKEVALEYMENKYGEEFEVVKIYKYSYGREIGILLYVNRAADEEKKDYRVRVFLDDDKTTHYVHSDNYMCTLVEPILMNRMNEIFEQISTEYIGTVDLACQLNEYTDPEFFLSDFPIPSDDLSLKDITENNTIMFDYEISIPESIYSEELMKRIWEEFRPYFTDDHILCVLTVYPDEDFNNLKNAEDWREVYQNERYWFKEIDTKYFGLHESEFTFH